MLLTQASMVVTTRHIEAKTMIGLIMSFKILHLRLHRVVFVL